MASEDVPGGLFSKVVNFVRPQATPWTELDKAGSDQQNLSRKQLKAIVERRRHNELLRKREFDLLRKLRRRDPQAALEVSSHPSLLDSSLPPLSPTKPPQQTLKKIADIEADMSMKWWHPDAPGRAAYDAPDVPDAPAPAIDPALPPVNPPAAPAWPSLAAGTTERESTSFSTSKSLAVEVAEVARDVGLEDAAMHFANAEDAAAEDVLLNAIAPRGERHHHADTWLALFDFYRATGLSARFDALAVAFAQRFDRSAPPWFSMPALVRDLPAPPPLSPAKRPADWTAPDALSRFAVMTLSAIQPRQAGHWRLDWSQLAEIDLGAAEPLLRLLRNWRDQPLQLQFIQPERLERVLLQATPVGQASVNPVWWQLRMETCRVMGQVEAFDQVALDYCVTYEVSPPSWEPVVCRYTPVDALGFPAIDFSLVNGNVVDTALLGPSAYRQSEWHTGVVPLELPVLPGGRVVSAALAGELTGEAPPALAQLVATCADADVLQINCSQLIRLDFAAAGALLNWASAQCGEKRQVQFNEVHRLLAPLFSVIGISGCATVQVRTD